MAGGGGEKRVNEPRAIRFSDSTWTLIQAEAAREGISASQYVREAAIGRAMYGIGQRAREEGDPSPLEKVLAEVRTMLNDA